MANSGRTIWLAAALLAISASSLVAQQRIIGYYPSWGAQNGYPVANIPGDKLTHVYYAFAKVAPEGHIVPGMPAEDLHREYPAPIASINGQVVNGNFGELLKLKQRYPHLRCLISVGGWDWSGGFSKMAQSPRGRRAFTDSAMDFVEKYGFDGVDIDWEFPVSGGQFPATGAPDDRENMTWLLQELRRGLSALERRTGKRYELTIAVPAANENLRHFDLAAQHESVDWILLMAYDLWGSWSQITSHHAPLSSGKSLPASAEGRNVEDSVDRLLSAGVPAKKIIVGIPFFGRGVVGVDRGRNGLYQRQGGAAQGTLGDEQFYYSDLVRNYFRRYPCFWDEEAQAGWLYAPDHNGLMISYEDRRSATEKARFVRAKQLGGIMVWELTMDAEGSASLLNAIVTALRN